MKYLYLCTAILISTGLLLWQLSAARNELKIPAQTQYVEWFGRDVTFHEINEQGQLKQTLYAQSLQHYMPDNITQLAKINLRVLPTQAHANEWFLYSDKGKLFHGEDKQDIIRVDLWHNVQLLRPATADESAVKINTSTLAVFPPKEYAHTSQYTIVNQVGHQMSGDGLEVFFATEEFNLLKNVSGFHENAS